MSLNLVVGKTYVRNTYPFIRKVILIHNETVTFDSYDKKTMERVGTYLESLLSWNGWTTDPWLEYVPPPKKAKKWLCSFQTFNRKTRYAMSLLFNSKDEAKDYCDKVFCNVLERKIQYHEIEVEVPGDENE